MDTDRIVGAAKNVAGKVERAAGEAFDSGSSQVRGAAREAEGAAQNAFGQVKDVARDAADAATNAASDAYDHGAEFVAERPGSALLVAGLLGFALGVVLTRSAQPRPRSRWQRMYDG